MFREIKRRLGYKFFISYLLVISIGTVVLITATEFTVPSAFDHHMAEMSMMMGPSASRLESDLYNNFQNAVNESLMLAVGAGFVSVVIVSIFVSRQVVAPIERMMVASRRIAEGNYNERVQIPRNLNEKEMDELWQLSLSFNQMTQKLEKAENLRKQLIGDIAHELRTPLSTIKGSMEGLIDGVLPAESDTYYQVYKEVDRLQRLVSDLQDLNRVEAGAMQLELKPISVNTLVETAYSRLNRQFEEKGVSLSSDIPINLPSVMADEDRFAQILLNLVGNALQYTPRGGLVKITAKEEANSIVISIKDTGIGIAAEHLPHIFTRFYRVDKSRSRVGGGSGIGLTVAKHLVESHGGKISASSPGINQGSTFTISLPII
jgi:histidine kinase